MTACRPLLAAALALVLVDLPRPAGACECVTFYATYELTLELVTIDGQPADLPGHPAEGCLTAGPRGEPVSLGWQSCAGPATGSEVCDTLFLGAP